MIQAGQKHGSWVVLKPSGNELWEISNGKKIIRVTTENLKKGVFEGDLMVNLAQAKKKTEPKMEKEAAVKTKPAKRVSKTKAKPKPKSKKKGN